MARERSRKMTVRVAAVIAKTRAGERPYLAARNPARQGQAGEDAPNRRPHSLARVSPTEVDPKIEVVLASHPPKETVLGDGRLALFGCDLVGSAESERMTPQRSGEGA